MIQNVRPSPCVVAYESVTGSEIDGVSIHAGSGDSVKNLTEQIAVFMCRRAETEAMVKALLKATYIHYGNDGYPVSSFRFATPRHSPEDGDDQPSNRLDSHADKTEN
ncbi:MAG: hypothetical protein AAGJ81_01530 [Verrucomicrobiota bacterium]